MTKILFASPLIALTFGLPSVAEQPITPEEFRAYSEGYTLYFEQDGEPFGSESFGPDGESKWRYQSGVCVEGAWRPHGAQICFYYIGEQGVQCWRMLRDEQGLIARLLGEGDNAGLELRINRRDREPLLCGGPGADL